MTRRVPHRVAEPRVNPAARRSRADAPQLPVFIDQSGWRRRTLQGVALAVGCACLGYLLFVGALISGLRQPVGTHPPSTGVTAPSGPDTGTSQRGHGTPDRAEGDRAQTDRTQTDRTESGRTATDRSSARAVGDRDDHHRPPPGRSVPSAGGPRQ
ncbi:hypothetical protein ACH4SP_04085 [Streptomyces sp. NPDC021093]|uniref:hypothetical protein n=1 Tax=Streptomyces sp. NPDC021093 TaxID=3365112 RepID=UPI0037AD4DCD